ncbi:MAG: precorrin-8X methylmutase, partial [Candidatus Synechococcus spongiarum 142]
MEPSPIDHPILMESLALIQQRLPPTGLHGVQQEVLVRLIHSSGDWRLTTALRCPAPACEQAMAALARGAPILTDTAMAAAAVTPMAQRTFANPVINGLALAPAAAPPGQTRTALGLAAAVQSHPRSVVVIGSAPTALLHLLALGRQGHLAAPVLVVGMPVGFVGVHQSKAALARSGWPQVRLEGSRGGAGLAAAVVNTLLRR